VHSAHHITQGVSRAAGAVGAVGAGNGMVAAGLAAGSLHAQPSRGRAAWLQAGTGPTKRPLSAPHALTTTGLVLQQSASWWLCRYPSASWRCLSAALACAWRHCCCSRAPPG
jgi:hypothetical protein